MARGKQGDGVQIRARDYRVRFSWRGKRYQVPVPLTPTAAHTAHVKRLAVKVRAAIELGTFTFQEFFPDSAEAKASQAATPPAEAPETFGVRGDTWKRSRGAPLSHWQQKKDADYLRFWKKVIGPDRVMATIVPSEIHAIIAEHPWKGPKHRNNLLACLRGIFDSWVGDDLRNRESPIARVKNGKVQKKRPDPFNMEEVELILADMAKHYDERIVAYYEFAFFTGMRPEEQIALRWPKVDGRQKNVVVDVARTRGKEKTTKTDEGRTVDLNPRAWAALERMRKWTAMKGDGPSPPHVFENPRTGRPWASEADQRDIYWTPTLKRLRLRHRRAYQTRSTCATMYLLAGYEPSWIAQQLGHSERVFWEAYAETIKIVRRQRDVHHGFEEKLARLKGSGT